MRSTYLSLHCHLIFSTKHHQSIIDEAWRNYLHGYIGKTIKALGAIPEAVGGTNDHVHILIGLQATHQLSYVLRDIKKESSRWVHQQIGINTFGWQDGYGAFTVSVQNLSTIKNYIANQMIHH